MGTPARPVRSSHFPPDAVACSAWPTLFPGHVRIGITAQTVIINQVASSRNATLKTKATRRKARQDGSFLTTAIITLDAPYPVGNLYLQVHGRSIERLNVLKSTGGAFMVGHSGKREGYSFTNIPNAFGEYRLQILSGEAEQFELIYKIK